MNRRHFLTSGASFLAGAALADSPLPQRSGVPLDQEPLPYDFGALEPFLDAAMVKEHYQKHHAAYVADLHKVLASVHLQAASVSSLLKTVEFLPPRSDRSVMNLGAQPGRLPEQVKQAIRTNGGGHMNHTLFWRYMAPPGSGPDAPEGKLAAAINDAFGSFPRFRKAFAAAALKHVGPGWAWLSYRPDKGLFISTTANEDNPLMQGSVPDAEFGRPILCLDLWEHAYSPKYRGRREDYIAAWWSVVNWPRVAGSYGIVTTTSS